MLKWMEEKMARDRRNPKEETICTATSTAVEQEIGHPTTGLIGIVVLYCAVAAVLCYALFCCVLMWK